MSVVLISGWVEMAQNAIRGLAAVAKVPQKGYGPMTKGVVIHGLHEIQQTLDDELGKLTEVTTPR